ncbi:BAG domain protein [Fusarium sp. NRRL 25303]|nr:BAG domain protein [Fusarium sp. NRRL 25303]
MSKSIDQLVQDCIIGFEGLCVQLENPYSRYISKPEALVQLKDGRSRFARWSRNAGAGSLEWKLQNNRRVKEQAIRLLSHIQRLLEDAHAIAVGHRVPWDQINDEDEDSQSENEMASLDNSPATEMGQILAHIADGIDNLSYLDAAFGEPFVNNRTMGETSPFEPFDVQHVQSKYPAPGDNSFGANNWQSWALTAEEDRLAGEPTIKGLTNQFTLVALTDQGSEHQEDFDEASSETSYIASEDLKARQIPPLPQRAPEEELVRCHLCHKMVRGLSATAWNHIGKHQKQLALFAIPRGLTMAHETPLQHDTKPGIHELDPVFREAGTSETEDFVSLDKDQKETTAQAASELDGQSGTSMRTTDYFSIGKEAVTQGDGEGN